MHACVVIAQRSGLGNGIYYNTIKETNNNNNNNHNQKKWQNDSQIRSRNEARVS